MEIRKISAEQTLDMRHKVMWPDRNIEYVKLKEDHKGMHFGLFIDDVMVSVVSAFTDGDSAQLRKFATAKEEQRKGYGSYLFNEVVKILKSIGIKRVWCNARVTKILFYNNKGLIETDVRFEKGGEKYIIMEKFL